MTTTTSTTAAQSASTIVSAATQSLLTSLNSGSGVDTGTLVAGLVQAQFAAKNAQLTAKADALTTQLSSATTLKSTISNFATALQTLVKGGSLATQPVSSNAAIGVSAIAGAKLAGLSSTISVNQLASAQSVRTKDPVADRTATIGSGTFTLTFGKATYDATGTKMTAFDDDLDDSGTADKSLTIDVTNASLDGIAAAINAKKAGVTASVVTDANGAAYLSLKGQTGAANGFTLAATDDPSGRLAQFAVGPVGTSDTSTTSITGAAQNAELVVDGIPVQRASNSISDLVTGVKLELTAKTTAPVTLSSTTPTAATTQAVNDFVETFNEVMKAVTAQTDPKTGALRFDPAAKTLQRSLGAFTSQQLVLGAAAGTPTTLAGIGVRTNRDGTLSVDTAALTKAMADTPDAVEAMFRHDGTGINGISAMLDKISSGATSVLFGLGASETRYSSQKSDVADAQAKISDQATAMATRLTQQYSSMNSKVSAYKATQSFLTNQIAAWNKSTS